MKILLTGGTGFIGKNFISKNYKNKKYQIFSIQRSKKNRSKNINNISCDLSNKKKLISMNLLLMNALHSSSNLIQEI